MTSAGSAGFPIGNRWYFIAVSGSGLVVCIGVIGTTWLGLDAMSVVTPPRHSHRYACVGAPSSRSPIPAPSGTGSTFTPLVDDRRHGLACRPDLQGVNAGGLPDRSHSLEAGKAE